MDESRQSELKAFTNRFQKTEIIFKILKSTFILTTAKNIISNIHRHPNSLETNPRIRSSIQANRQ